MRSFPGAARQRLLAASAAGVVSLGLLIPLAHAEDSDDPADLEQRQERVQNEIDATADDLDEASKEVADATRRLDDAKARLAEAREELLAVTARLTAAREQDAELRADLAASEAELAEADAELREGRAAVDDQRAAVRASVIGIYTQGDPRLRAIGSLLGAGSLEDLTRRRQADDLIVDRGARTFADLTRAEEALDAQQARVEAATEAVARDRTDAAAHLDVVQDLYDDAAAAEAGVDALVASSREARAEAFAARRRDRAELAELRERERDIAQRIREAAARDRSVGFTGASGGFLSYPVDAPVTSPFGYRIHPIYGYYALHAGTDFGVPCGTPLVASAAGTISDTYTDSVFGSRLFLDVGKVNGQNLTVVYNHLSGYVAGEGQRVARGDVVAYSGTSGWSTGCHLHFTVLVNGTPVDPMTYL